MKICGQSPLAKALRRRWWYRRCYVFGALYPCAIPDDKRVRFVCSRAWTAIVEQQHGEGWKVVERWYVGELFGKPGDRTIDELCRWLNKL